METKEDFNLIEKTVTAYIIKDIDGYIIYSKGANGVMVKSPTKENAENDFKSALNMVHAVRNLHYFHTAVNADNTAKETFVRGYKKPSTPEVNYVETNFA